jgi:hypothetical protein
MSAAPRSDAAGFPVRPGEEPWTTEEVKQVRVCESCGQPIGKARLLAFPRATLCVACKQRQERR